MSDTTTAGTVTAVRISLPFGDELPVGWMAWNMPCGCREAVGPNNEWLTTRCAAACECWQCTHPAGEVL